MVKSAIDTFVSFSFLPIRAISFLGLLVSVLSFLFGFYVVVNKVLFGTHVDGWTSVMLAVLVLGGVQLVMIGVLGEYLWRILDEARARPLYIVESHAQRRTRPLARSNSVRLPDFLIGGAPRSGTTWLYQLLDRHPGVYMAQAAWRPSRSSFSSTGIYEKGLAYYAETWFAGAGAGQKAGEKSTDYLESEAAAERIARDLPQVKLVFILREPVGARVLELLVDEDERTRDGGVRHGAALSRRSAKASCRSG